MGVPFTQAAITARLNALDASVPVIEAMPGDNAATLERIAQAAMLLKEKGMVRQSNLAFGEVVSLLKQHNQIAPDLVAKIATARELI